MEKKSIPSRVLYPVVFASLTIVALVLFGVPDLITIPVSVVTVVWIGVLIARHYLAKPKQEEGGA